MGEHTTRNRRLSPTVEEAKKIVRLLTEEQLDFLRAFDPTMERAYNFPELGKRMGEHTEDYAERQYRAIGRIIQRELGANFDFDYMIQHGLTSWPPILFNAVKRERWYFTLGPELQAALMEEEVLPPSKYHRIK